ncbi:MAG: hypothetical protein DMG64_08680 [Acidobacteria bacterium]|nr:MAG: hypothetical protein DMG64_08680 [Acidobacteriota bacterium]
MNMLQAAAPAGAKTEAESPFADFDEVIRLYQQRVYRLVLAQTGEPDLAGWRGLRSTSSAIIFAIAALRYGAS